MMPNSLLIPNLLIVPPRGLPIPRRKLVSLARRRDLIQAKRMIQRRSPGGLYPLFGSLSDRWSRRRTYIAGCLFLIVFALPYFALLELRDPLWIVVATVLGVSVGHALLYSVQASLIPELFGTRLRCTGASIGYQLAVPLSGGVAPLIAAVLIRLVQVAVAARALHCEVTGRLKEAYSLYKKMQL